MSQQGRTEWDAVSIRRRRESYRGKISDSVCKLPGTEAEAPSPGLGAEPQGCKLAPTLSCYPEPIQGLDIEPASGAK